MWNAGSCDCQVTCGTLVPVIVSVIKLVELMNIKIVEIVHAKGML